MSQSRHIALAALLGGVAGACATIATTAALGHRAHSPAAAVAHDGVGRGPQFPAALAPPTRAAESHVVLSRTAREDSHPPPHRSVTGYSGGLDLLPDEPIINVRLYRSSHKDRSLAGRAAVIVTTVTGDEYYFLAERWHADPRSTSGSPVANQAESGAPQADWWK